MRRDLRVAAAVGAVAVLVALAGCGAVTDSGGGGNATPTDGTNATGSDGAAADGTNATGTGGATGDDGMTRQELRENATRILEAAREDGNLSKLVRYWNGSESHDADTWAHAIDRPVGYGSRTPGLSRDGGAIASFGPALNRTFTQEGHVYNVYVEYPNASAGGENVTIPMVYRGVPSNDSVTVTATVVLYDEDTLTGYNQTDQRVDCTEKPIEEIKPEFGPTDWNSSFSPDCYFPIPESAAYDDDDQDPIFYDYDGGCNPHEKECPVEEAKDERDETGDDPVYNVVLVRLIVW